jgi:hypothetical protein
VNQTEVDAGKNLIARHRASQAATDPVEHPWHDFKADVAAARARLRTPE